MSDARGLFLTVLLTAVFSLSVAEASSRRPPLPEPQTFIVWDGENPDQKAVGWAGPEVGKGGTTWATLKPVKGAGIDNGTALVWTAKGPEWKGFGWNWFSWWPSNAGTDITPYKFLVFKIRFDRISAADPLALDALNVTLSCSDGGGRRSVELPILAYLEEDPADGKWHEVVIPLKDILNDEASRAFNPKKTWELGMNMWTPENQDFTLVVDSIGFR
jgi:hypothetical protein